MAIKSGTSFQVPLQVQDEASGPLAKIGEKAEGTGKSLEELALDVTGLNEALELAKKVYEAVMGTLEQFEQAYGRLQKSQIQLQSTMAMVGDYTKEGMERFSGLAEEIERTTDVDKVQVLGLLAKAKAMQMTNEMAELTVKTAVNMAAMNGDVAGSFQRLAMSTNGVTRGLDLYDKGIKNVSPELAKQGEIIKMLATRFDGLGAATGKSLSSMQAQAEHALEGLKEEIGKTLAELFDAPGRMQSQKAMWDELTHILRDEVKPVLMEVRQEVVRFFTGMKDGFNAVNWSALLPQLKLLGVVIAGLAVVLAGPALAAAILSVGALALQFAAIGIAVIGAAAAVDIVLKNMDKLPQVAAMFGDAFLLALSLVREGISKLFLFLFQQLSLALQSLASAYPQLSKVALDAVMVMTAGSKLLTDELISAQNASKGLAEQLAQSSKGLNLGMLGAGVTAAKQFWTGLQSGMAKAPPVAVSVEPKAPENRAKQTGPDPLSDENRKALDDILKKGNEASAALDKANESAYQVALAEHQMRLQNIDLLEAQLVRQNQLTEFAKAGIAAARMDENSTFKQSKPDKSIMDDLIDISTLDADFAKAMDGAVKAAFSGDDIGTISDAMAKAMAPVTQTLGDAFDIGGQALSAGASAILDVGGAIIDGLSSGKWLDMIKQFAVSVDNLPQLLLTAVAKIGPLIQQIVAALPGMVRNLLAVMPVIVGQLVGMLPGIIRSLTAALPTMITELFKSLSQIGVILIQAVPGLIEALIQHMPQIVEAFTQGLIDMMGELSIVLIDTLVKSAPRLIETIIGAAPRIALAIVQGMIRALADLGKMLGGMLFNGVKLPAGLSEFPRQLSQGLSNLASQAAKDSSQVFKVIDLATNARGLTAAEAISNALVSSADAAGNRIAGLWTMLKELWTWIWDKVIQPFLTLLQKAWQWVYDKILAPLGALVSKAWQWVLDKVLLPIASFVQAGFQWVLDKVITPLEGIGQRAFQWVSDKIITPLLTLLLPVWQWVYDHVVAPLTSGLTAVFNLFKTIGDGVSSVLSKAFSGLVDALKDGVAAAFKDVISFFKDLLAGNIKGAFASVVKFFSTDLVGMIKADFGFVWSIFDGLKNISIPAFDAFKNAIENLFKTPGWLQKLIDAANSLSGGGGSGNGELNKILGTGWRGGLALAGEGVQYMAAGGPAAVSADTVPAMLMPGEFVVSRPNAQANYDTLRAINASGGKPVGAGGGMTLNIAAGAFQIIASGLDAQTVQAKVVPAVLKAIKDESLRGRWLMDTRGLRSTTK